MKNSLGKQKKPKKIFSCHGDGKTQFIFVYCKIIQKRVNSKDDVEKLKKPEKITTKNVSS